MKTLCSVLRTMITRDRAPPVSGWPLGPWASEVKRVRSMDAGPSGRRGADETLEQRRNNTVTSTRRTITIAIDNTSTVNITKPNTTTQSDNYDDNNTTATSSPVGRRQREAPTAGWDNCQEDSPPPPLPHNFHGA